MKKLALAGLVLLSLACQGTSSPPSTRPVPNAVPDPKATPLPSTSASVTEVSPATPLDAGATAAAVLPSVALANNALAGDLYGQLKARPGNLFFSPISISIALMMAYGGAKGTTQAAMAKVLHLADGATHAGYGGLVSALSSAPPGPVLRVANRFYADKTLVVEPGYLTLTHDAYAAPLELVDFKTEDARLAINGWVERQTNDKIKDLIPPKTLDDSTKLVLVNAVYFKGSWSTPFKPSETKDAPFHGAAGSKNTPMMHASLHVKYGENADVQLVELPYADPSGARTLAMDVVLPRDKNGLAKLEALIASSGLDAVATKPLGYEQAVDVTLPRTKMTSSFELSSPLAALGMGVAFGKDADFTGIAKAPSVDDRLRIAKVLHKAFVDVNEEGTEAAAATAIVMAAGGGAPAPPKVFLADHPFLFLVRDTKSGAILFLGRMTDST
ncbi:MAG TPA: serpin family protein [Polyangiaceae bacterium]